MTRRRHSDRGHLEYAARRAAEEPGFLAHTIARFMELEGSNEADVADLLGLPGRIPPLLALASTPTGEGVEFASQVRRVAELASASPEGLARLIRRVDALGRLATAQGAATAMLAAARDRLETREGETGEGSESS